ncbi:MAG: SAM-dependent methyltransferase [Bacteroidetes bacterium]|nr:SAM-dependent methyltransferase [Bacteroidota bacterium]
MAIDYFHNYLINIGFDEKEISESPIENIFCYSPHPKAPSVKYIHVAGGNDIFSHHLRLWNQNRDNAFVAVSEKKTYIIDLKKKPDPAAVLSSSVCIKTFNYGTNSDDVKDVDIELISKNQIDSSIFYHFLQQKQRKKQEVDKDLLLNLIALRNDLIDKDNEQIIHLLILRSLFVKYLEDRGIFTPNFLPDILESRSPQKLISAFEEVCKINGDVFESNKLSEKDIKTEYLDKLYLFFTTDYQNGQGTLFPYQFANIPIQLISHVYEAFLKNDTKKGKGIYYTPSFIVNFMLSQTLKDMAVDRPQLTVLDPAVGSGTFLVESFKILRDSLSGKLKRKLTILEKKQILEKNLWGIDVDNDALQITAFSLYLAMLEDEPSEFIRNEIELSHPILPSLIGRTLLNANTITDSVFENEKFDFIVSNPPWGSVPADLNIENVAEREAIDNINGAYPEYDKVADYERSQAFLRRVERWRKKDTLSVMIVKNSIFLNDKAECFRRDFLEKNQIIKFFELSHYNKILFKKKIIGNIRGKEPVEIGASEPCAIVIFKSNRNNEDYSINYISPKLTKLGEHFELIQYSANESFHVEKKEFIEHDSLWRILVNGDYEGFKLIEHKLLPQKELEIEARTGFQPKQNMQQLGAPDMKSKIEPQDFEAFYQKNSNLSQFNWNQSLHRRRDESIFCKSRILLPVRPLKEDRFKLRGLHLKKEILFSDNIISIKLKAEKTYIDKFPYMAFLNSKMFGYYCYQISSQWGKGEEKRAKLRNVDLETLPIKKINNKQTLIQISNHIKEIILLKSAGKSADTTIDKLEEIVSSFYGLTEYEQEIIKEFYQVNVERADEKLKLVQSKDIITYFNAFKESFSLVLSPDHTVNASFNISQNIGAIIKIAIEEKNTEREIALDNTLQILQFVKNKQITETDKLLKEEKIKIYETKHFYLIKSNQVKDWTKRQAYKDAKEEIDLLLSNLPDTNE